MSSTRPPAPPPPGSPGGPPEYLESGGGGPVPPQPRSGSPVRKALLLGGGALGLAAAGVGAWAAYSFFTTGPQPAQALPAATLGYASIDLDPSGGQKIEALRTLDKFPAFADEVGLDTDDDLRKAIFDRIQGEANCPGLDYGKDIEPWLGDRAAIAAVDLGGDDPDPVVVLQVKDADRADAGLDKIRDCAGGEGGGWAVSGDWAVIAESDDLADDVVKATAKGSLADDEDFTRWTGEAGDPGVVTLYAGPAAGDYLADHTDGFLGLPLSRLVPGGGMTDCYSDEVGSGDDSIGGSPEGCSSSDPGSSVVADLQQRLRDFGGVAATIRFQDGALELETAGDSTFGIPGGITAGGAADVVESLPGDTAAVLGIGFADGWFGDLVDYVAPYTGSDAQDLLDQLSELTGLDLPEDAETLAGDAAALTLGSDFDPSTFFDSPDGSGIPVALKVTGDPDEIEKVLDKLRAMAGPQVIPLESDASGQSVVIGPDADYRARVLEDGDLGDNKVFQGVVREADRAHTVLFVNVDELEDAIRRAAGEGDQDFVDNLRPIAGFGVTGWIDGEVTHAVVRLTTD